MGRFIINSVSVRIIIGMGYVDSLCVGVRIVGRVIFFGIEIKDRFFDRIRIRSMMRIIVGKVRGCISNK